MDVRREAAGPAAAAVPARPVPPARLRGDGHPRRRAAAARRADDLFAATPYSLQLACSLPAVLQCRDFELRGRTGWGRPQGEDLELSNRDGLVADAPETGTYVPPE
ncbi:MAG: hypothetical protein U0746_11205 [Gemmataceae bacterium]